MEQYLRVVAPTSCNPRARAGLIIWPASTLPSAFPRLNNVSKQDMRSGLYFDSQPQALTNFVNETDNISSLFLDIANESFEFFFKLSSNARTCHYCRQINRQNTLMLQRLYWVNLKPIRRMADRLPLELPLRRCGWQALLISQFFQLQVDQ